MKKKFVKKYWILLGILSALLISVWIDNFNTPDIWIVFVVAIGLVIVAIADWFVLRSRKK
jgi:uncharacterized membrane-anchored protein YjiN (DUF445 family)